MKRILALAILCVALFAVTAQAATEVKMTGDARIHANFFSNLFYTGWNPTGTQNADNFVIWERFRLRTDFIANENLKFRLGMRVNDIAWGNSTMRVDNPAVSIDVYQCFLQFKWPNTDVQFTVGLTPVDLPISSADLFGANPVLGGTQAAMAMFDAPIMGETVQVSGGFMRLMKNNTLFQNTTTTQYGTLDAFFLTLPISVDGFKATPWAVLGVLGRDAALQTVGVGSNFPSNESLGTNMMAVMPYSGATTYSNQYNTYWWVGTTLAVTALDPFKFYGDVIYGSGANGDRSSSKRAGFFFDVAAEYTGFDMLTPQVAFWYATGEDSSVGNGSERMPVMVTNWGPSTSFLFNTSQEFAYGFMATNPMGSMGFAVSLNNMSFIKDLTHRLTFTYAHGTNSAAGLRKANLISGVGNYLQMGRDLTENEYTMAVNFDNAYAIYENLSAIVETGWAHGDFQSSVWGRRFTNRAQDGDAWKVAFGFVYKF